jgi:hypothetical protein
MQRYPEGKEKVYESHEKLPFCFKNRICLWITGTKNDLKVDQIKISFDKMAKKYPYPSESTAESELMAYAARLKQL